MHAIRFSLAIFVLIFSIALGDIIYDWTESGKFDPHIIVEIFMALASFIAITVLLTSTWLSKKELIKTYYSLGEAHKALDTAKHQTQKLMGELSKVIQAQFIKWQLTDSEKEVALLLIKGLSLDEIATVRETKEKTVRQQASNLYKKAGITGRYELVAFFLKTY